MALIEKRPRMSGKPTYRVRVKYRGRVLSSTHTDRSSAERWAAQTGAHIRDDAHFAGEANRRRTLADLIDRYVEHVLPGKGNARSQGVHLVWWRKKIGHLPLASVTCPVRMPRPPNLPPLFTNVSLPIFRPLMSNVPPLMIVLFV